MNREHTSFPQPADPKESVWRYMDLARFVALLSSKKLFFPSVEVFDDPFEGAVPRLSRPAHAAMVLAAVPADIREALARSLESGDEKSSRFNEKARRSYYVSCWRLGNHESEAMWKLYCGADQGVAVTTSYERLAESITEEWAYIGCVSYLDYDTAVLPGNNVYSPYMCKRIAFAHEREVRIVKSRWAEIAMEPDKDVPLPRHIEAVWDPELHAERIVVSPYARPWFHQVVRDVTSALASTLTSKVTESTMAAKPRF